MNVAASEPKSQSLALLAGIGVFVAWGFVAEFFQLLIDRGIPADVLLAHRVVWSTVFCFVVVFLTGGTRPMLTMVRDRARLARLLLSALLIAGNWLTFIYAIETHQRTDAALGYFVNPLMSVAMGVVLLGERLSPIKWACVALAAVGVTMIVVASGGRLPWIAASLALTFAFYGLVRKKVSVEPVQGLAVETALLLPAAVAYLAWVQITRPIAVAPATHGLLMLAGVLTAVPLMMFGYAARRLPLGTLGFLQYLAPTLQLVMAVLLRGEPIRHRIGGFILIWTALILFSLSSVRWRRTDATAELGV